MLLSAVAVLVVAQSSSEIPEGLTNNPVDSIYMSHKFENTCHEFCAAEGMLKEAIISM